MTMFELDYILVTKTLVCGRRYNSRTMLAKDFFVMTQKKVKTFVLSLILRSHGFIEIGMNKNS